MSTVDRVDELMCKYARSAVRKAIAGGALIRPTACSKCHRTLKRIVAHHYLGYDVAHWLDVQWMCRRCHLAIHGVPSTKAKYTLDERREFRTRGLRKRTSERVHADAVHGGLMAGGSGPRKYWASMTADERSERASRLRLQSSVERRNEIASKGWETRRRRIAEGVTYKKSGPKPKTEEVMPA